MKKGATTILSVAFLSVSVLVSSCKCKKEAVLSGRQDVQVTFVSPKGEAGQPRNVIASFSSPMVPITLIGKLVEKGPFVITPSVDGKYHWIGTKTVSFVPSVPFQFATKYNVSIKRDTVDVNGNGLLSPVAWDFETARALLVSSEPANGADGVTLDKNILLYFNQPVEPSKLLRHLSVSATIQANEVGSAKTPSQTIMMIKMKARRPSVEEWKNKSGNIDNAVILSPERKLPMSAVIELTIDAGFKGKEGRLAVGREQKLNFATYGPLEISNIVCTTDCDPLQPMSIQFTNFVVPKEVLKHIKIEPSVELKSVVEYETRYLYLRGDFLPNTKYVLSIAKDAGDIYGNTLGKQTVINYETSNFPPFLDAIKGFGVLEAGGHGEISVLSRNVGKIYVRTKDLTADELIKLVEQDIIHGNVVFESGLTFSSTLELEPESEPNKKIVTPIKIGNEAGKMVLVDIYAPDYKRWGAKEERPVHFVSIVQVTDLGVTAKFFEGGVLVWVTSLATGEPIAGASVEIRDSENKVCLRGVTDEKGILMGAISKPLPRGAGENEEFGEGEDGEYYEETYYVFVQMENDRAFSISQWSSGFDAWDFGLEKKWSESAIKADLFTERGVYKPGETIHMKAIVRSVTDAGVSIPKPLKGVIRAFDSRDEEYFSQEAVFTDFGTASADITIPLYAATGQSQLVVEIKEPGGKGKQEFDTYVNIEVYRPAEFKVETKARAVDYVAGDDVKVGVSASYLFGEPMKGSPYDWSVFKSRTTFYPKGFEEYWFGKIVLDWEHELAYEEFETSGSGLLNNSGEAEIVIPLKVGGVKETTRYSVETSVRDVNEREISTRSSVILHPGNFYIGLKRSSFIVNALEPMNVDIVGVRVDGSLAEGMAVQTKLFKRDWHAVKKQSVTGYEYERKAVDTEISSCNVKTASKPVRCSLIPKEGGLYYITAESRDSRGNPVSSSVWTYVTGVGDVAWRPEPHDRINLVADKKTYAPGDTARIMIESPFDACRALVTYERDGVMSQEVVQLEGYTPTLAVPIIEKMVPNVYVSVVLVKGRVSQELSEEERDEGRPRVKVGYINLSVNAVSKRLGVAVKTDKKEASPGDEVEVTVDVTEHSGKAAVAEVAIMAVDTGSLMLTGYKLPDPYNTFYDDKELGVTTSDSRINLIGRRSYGVKGETPASGGGMAEEFRRLFLPVAYWNPSAKTDEKGRVVVKFRLPDNLTTFRIMAVAVTADKFGSGEAEVIVRKSFMLRANLPHFVSPGDAFDASVIIDNYTSKEVSGAVSIRVEGLTLVGNDKEAFKIPPDAKQEVFFRLKAEKAGKAVLGFSAETDSGADALELPLDVRLTVPKEVFASYGETETEAMEIIEVPAEIYPDVGGLEIGIASTALTGLEDGALHLTRYPYECLEQRISKAIGMIMYGNIMDALGKENESAEKYKEYISLLLKEMYRYQGWSGGFGFWESQQREPNPYVSIYAVYFMTVAKENGYELDQEVYNKAISYLKDILRWDAKERGYEPWFLNSLKAYALYALALSGNPEKSYHEIIYNTRDSMSPSARAQLMIAIKDGGGIPAQFDDFVRYVSSNLDITPNEAGFRENDVDYFWYRTNVYTNAYVLKALMKIDPSFPHLAGIAKRLLYSARDGHWESTHVTAAVLTALYDYMRTREPDADFFAEAVLGEEKLMTGKFEKGGAKEISKTVSIGDMPQGFGQTPLVFKKDGKGVLYYRARLSYAPSTRPLPHIEEGFTINKKMSLYGKGGESSVFKRGDIVEVRLDFVAPGRRHYVVVSDGLPAGLEPINFTLETARSHLVLGMDGSSSPYVNHVEISGDKVLIFADYLPEGVYSFTYLAKAATRGEFFVPPVYIEEMYYPEVFGRSLSGSIEIK